MRSNAERLTTRSLTTGKAPARHGSTVMTSPSWNLRMWSWQVAVPRCGPWAWPLIIRPHDAADALAAVVLEGDRLLAEVDEPVVEDVEHLEERHLVADAGHVVGLQLAGRVRPGLAPDLQREVQGLGIYL